MVAFVALHSLVSADLAWAAKHKAPKPEEKAEKSYFFPYAIVGLGVMLGLIIVLRPGKRSDEPKRNENPNEKS